MVAQAAGRTHHDVAAALKGALLAARVHAPDADDDAGAGPGVKPQQFALDLQGQLARRRDHQGKRRSGRRHGLGLAQ